MNGFMCHPFLRLGRSNCLLTMSPVIDKMRNGRYYNRGRVMSQADFSRYIECSLELAVDLVNTADPVDGSEDIPDADALLGFLAEHHVSYRRRPSARDLEQVKQLRATLRHVFESRDHHEVAGILNRLLTESEACPELTAHDGEPWHLHATPPGRPLASRLTAETAMALTVLLAQGGFERLRVCEGNRCVDVFVDQTRNRSRRYCTTTVCGNRASVAAFRARRKAVAQPHP